MLVLSRQRDETIMIGDEIAITVVDIRGDKVRLGITAPTKIAVHRKEVYDAIKAENMRAAAAAGDLQTLRTAVGQSPVRTSTGPIAKAARLATPGPSLSLNGSHATPLAAPPTGLPLGGPTPSVRTGIPPAPRPAQ
jgi:carbon storage regulator